MNKQEKIDEMAKHTFIAYTDYKLIVIFADCLKEAADKAYEYFGYGIHNLTIAILEATEDAQIYQEYMPYRKKEKDD